MQRTNQLMRTDKRTPSRKKKTTRTASNRGNHSVAAALSTAALTGGGGMVPAQTVPADPSKKSDMMDFEEGSTYATFRISLCEHIKNTLLKNLTELTDETLLLEMIKNISLSNNNRLSLSCFFKALNTKLCEFLNLDTNRIAADLTALYWEARAVKETRFPSNTPIANTKVSNPQMQIRYLTAYYKRNRLDFTSSAAIQCSKCLSESKKRLKSKSKDVREGAGLYTKDTPLKQHATQISGLLQTSASAAAAIAATTGGGGTNRRTSVQRGSRTNHKPGDKTIPRRERVKRGLHRKNGEKLAVDSAIQAKVDKRFNRTGEELASYDTETVTFINRGKVTLADGSKINLKPVASKFYQINKTIIDRILKAKRDLSLPATDDPTDIKVIYNDCVSVARKNFHEGKRSSILNMANAYSIGGGTTQKLNPSTKEYFTTSGAPARAQEESLISDSNLFQALGPCYEWYRKDGGLGNDVIASTDVTFFRNFSGELANLKDVFSADVLTCAAPYLDGRTFHHLKQNPDLRQQYLRECIVKMLFTALNSGHEHLVLSAHGCGAFRNDPKEVSGIFKEVLELPFFKNKFRSVTFAIIDDRNAEVSNYKVFNDTFHKNGGERVRRSLHGGNGRRMSEGYNTPHNCASSAGGGGTICRKSSSTTNNITSSS